MSKKSTKHMDKLEARALGGNGISFANDDIKLILQPTMLSSDVDHKYILKRLASAWNEYKPMRMGGATRLAAKKR